MTTCRRFLVSLSALIVAFAASEVRAETFYFGGTVSRIDSTLVDSGFALGDEFSGSFTFEALAPTAVFLDSFGNPRAFYGTPPTALTVTVDGRTYSGTGEIQVWDNHHGLDLYGAQTIGPVSGPSVLTSFGTVEPFYFGIELFQSVPSSALTSADLPLIPPSLGDFSTRLLTLSFGGHIVHGNVAFLDVTSPIPEPESYAMLLAGLGVLGLTARRRKQKYTARRAISKS